jgi:hypothetical protein
MRWGETIHGGDGMEHVVCVVGVGVVDMFVMGVDMLYAVTYCNWPIREGLVSTPDVAPTCVRCIAMRQADVQTLRRFSLSD